MIIIEINKLIKKNNKRNFFSKLSLKSNKDNNNNVVSKLYGVIATILIFVFV